jgi:CpeT/CpcT family (DUF1001)
MSGIRHCTIRMILCSILFLLEVAERYYSAPRWTVQQQPARAVLVLAWVPTTTTMIRLRPNKCVWSKIQRRATISAAVETTEANHHHQHHLMDTLSLWFQGDFDNYRQVVQDRQAGCLPREYGGHEHIHCSLIPVTPTSRLAAFYFDGVPRAIFRFRFYRLETTSTSSTTMHHNGNNNNNSTVDTILYTLSDAVEQKLRACPDAMQWPSIFTKYVREEQSKQQVDPSIQSSDDDIANIAVQLSCVRLLPNCEVRWSWEPDPIQHAYVADFHRDDNDDTDHTDNTDTDDSVDRTTTTTTTTKTTAVATTTTTSSSTDSIHAVMVHGSALVDSQMLPGQKILIRDQLSLWSDQLWIHDRGFHPDTGAYIYGNQRGIPYRMQRVTSCIVPPTNSNSNSNTTDTEPPFIPPKEQEQEQQQPQPQFERHVTDPELAWTLGSDYRTTIEYEANMQIIGGSSRK